MKRLFTCIFSFFLTVLPVFSAIAEELTPYPSQEKKDLYIELLLFFITLLICGYYLFSKKRKHKKCPSEKNSDRH